MDFRKIIFTLYLVVVGSVLKTNAQDGISDSKYRFNFSFLMETTHQVYSLNGQSQYHKFALGSGVEVVFPIKKVQFGGAATLGYYGADHVKQTYSILNSDYYYRTTRLSGRAALNVQFFAKYPINKTILGIGYEPQFVLKTFRSSEVHGETVTSIPDIDFLKTTSGVTGYWGYMASKRVQAGLKFRYSVGALVNEETKGRLISFSFQIAKRI
ncbi:MAG: hypothetical protein H6607_08160 [Flavobacteriales bacterium]|nr:hypothetical protein [Flavobacteriales bacterium]